MKKYRITSAFFVVALAALGCAANEVRLDAGHSGSQKELARGQLLSIALRSNPTTGFRWQVAEFDRAILRQSGNAVYESSDRSGKLVGAGGIETFRFETVGAGRTTLTLVYRRSWEKNVPPANTYSVAITVR